MAYWLFQGNPKYYRIVEGIRDFIQMPWLVSRYAKEMQPGDGVLIWKAGQDAGVYAIAEWEANRGMGYWIDKLRLAYLWMVGLEEPCLSLEMFD